MKSKIGNDIGDELPVPQLLTDGNIVVISLYESNLDVKGTFCGVCVHDKNNEIEVGRLKDFKKNDFVRFNGSVTMSNK